MLRGIVREAVVFPCPHLTMSGTCLASRVTLRTHDSYELCHSGTQLALTASRVPR